MLSDPSTSTIDPSFLNSPSDSDFVGNFVAHTRHTESRKWTRMERHQFKGNYIPLQRNERRAYEDFPIQGENRQAWASEGMEERQEHRFFLEGTASLHPWMPRIQDQ